MPPAVPAVPVSSGAIGRDAAALLRLYVRDAGLRRGDRLPPERELAVILGLSRGALRTALARLKVRGEVWQRVGRGTFVGGQPGLDGAAVAKAEQIFDTTQPDELLDARLVLEPQLAALAAERATDEDRARIVSLAKKGARQTGYGPSHRAGDAIHRAIAQAAHNELLLWMFDHLFTVRGAIHWGRYTRTVHEQLEAEIWRDHAEIADAILRRDAQAAGQLMQAHLLRIRERIRGLTSRSQGGGDASP